VILQCLESVRPIVDYVLIEDDAGSTDGTAAVVQEWLDRVGMPGKVSAVPWRDFGYNRSHALASLRERKDIDYALMIDADDLLVPEPGFDAAAFKRGLSKDMYSIAIRQGATRYQRGQLCSNHREFKYRGVGHEFLQEPPGEISFGTVTGFYIESRREGARHHDPNKYRKDAQVFEQALGTEEDAFLRSRYTYYLAQSYRDAGDREKALENYLKRAELGYWTEEIFESLYAAAGLMQAMGRPFDDVLAMYLRAADAVPSRAEALHGASRLCREHKKFADGFAYARRGLDIPLPTNGLFVQTWIYDYALLDELAVNAYWSGRYQDSLDACERLLREGKMPADMHDRVKKNAEFAAEQIAKQGSASDSIVERVTPTSSPH
jgi:tetratricopeptide (TPR) repeat protein